jgi:hypothetical protein
MNKTKNMIQNKKDIDRMIQHNNALKQIPFIMKKDGEGFLYCIENSFYNGYNKKIYKISSTINMENMINDNNKLYFENCRLLRKLKVPKKLFYEFLMMLRLYKIRIKPNKNFYIDFKKINNAFDEMEELLKTKTEEEIHIIYLNYFKHFEAEKYCNVNLKISNICNSIPIASIYKKNSLRINFDIEDEGYIYWIEQPYLTEYFKNNIHIIIPSLSQEAPLNKSIFLEEINIQRVLKLKYFGIGKNMFNELIYMYNVKGFFYNLSIEKLSEIFDLIQKYFDTYETSLEVNFAFGNRVLG